MLSQSNPPLRQRRQRTNFNEDALDSLEEYFVKNPYPDINERETMARMLKTTEDRIQVWFQNKRARYRKKMHKSESNTENDDSSVKKPKARMSKKLPSKAEATPSSPIMQSPRFHPENIPNENSFSYVSTPVSSRIYHPAESFYSPYYDSGYISNLSSNSSFDPINTSRAYLQNLNLNSPSINPFALPFYNSPFFYHSLNQSFEQQQQQPQSLPPQQTESSDISQKSVKPFFRPYE